MTGGRTMSATRAVTALVATVLLSGCWLQPGFDGSQTRWNPGENRLTTANAADLAEVWSVEVTAPEVSEPLVAGGRVYVGRQASELRGGGVVAVSAATGEAAWERTTTPAGEYVRAHAPTFVEGELWSSWWDGEPDRCGFGTVRLDRDGAVVGTDDSAFPVSAAAQSGPYVVQAEMSRCPSGSDWPPTVLRVRDSRTLESLWTGEAGMGTVSGGQILSPHGFFPLAGCGAATCAPTAQGDEPVTVGQPYVARPDSDVFTVKPGFGARTAGVAALSRTTGQVVWRAATHSISASLAADDDRLYVAASSVEPGRGTVLAFDIDGCGQPTCRPVWSAAAVAGVDVAWAPTVAGGVVYVAGWDHVVRAYAAAGCGRPTCGEIGRLAVDGEIQALSVAGGRVFVVSTVVPGEVYRVTAFAPARS